MQSVYCYFFPAHAMCETCRTCTKCKLSHDNLQSRIYSYRIASSVGRQVELWLAIRTGNMAYSSLLGITRFVRQEKVSFLADNKSFGWASLCGQVGWIWASFFFFFLRVYGRRWSRYPVILMLGFTRQSLNTPDLAGNIRKIVWSYFLAVHFLFDLSDLQVAVYHLGFHHRSVCVSRAAAFKGKTK